MGQRNEHLDSPYVAIRYLELLPSPLALVANQQVQRHALPTNVESLS